MLPDEQMCKTMLVGEKESRRKERKIKKEKIENTKTAGISKYFHTREMPKMSQEL